MTMATIAACAGLAALELDVVLIAQTMVSRPLVAGIILGAFVGRPEAGALFGVVFELLSLGDLPVGGNLTWSATTAAGTATVLASAGTSFTLCFLGGVAAGVVHSRLEAVERARRASTGDALVRRAEAGEPALGRALGSSIAAHAAMTFSVSCAIVALVGFVDRRWWARAPEIVQAGASLAVSSAPWVGLSGAALWCLRRA